MRYLLPFFLLGLFSCQNTPKETEPSADDAISLPTIGKIVVLDPHLHDILDTAARIEVLAEGFTWSEGPLWLEEQQTLIWSDVPNNVIHQWREGDTASVYLQPSGFTGEGELAGEPGSNGLVLSPDGRLTLCQHGNRQVAIMDAPLDDPRPQFLPLAAQFEGKRFNSPNDAAYDADGHLYFTDPPYGLAQQADDPAREIPFQGVYRVSPEGEVFLLTDELSRPNGIAFSPDQTRCYVANSDPERPIWMVYDLDENKNFTNGRVFFDASDLVAAGKEGLPDGLKVNADGMLFATGPGGVLVLTPEGEHLGTIATGQATANCALHSDESVLYMTAHRYVARVALKK